MSENGPFSDWIGGSADAAVDFRISFDFWFDQSSAAECRIQLNDDTPIDPSYHVILPNWDAPADASAEIVEWWVGFINDTIAHERHHIEVWESYVPQMNDAVLTGTCDSVQDDLRRIYNRGSRENCQFDFEEYGQAAGLTIDDCVSS
jgi:predicted secreted Zn-dependent protease